MNSYQWSNAMHYSLASRHNTASFRSCDFYWDKRWQNNKHVYKDFFFVNVINVYHIYGPVDVSGLVIKVCLSHRGKSIQEGYIVLGIEQSALNQVSADQHDLMIPQRTMRHPLPSSVNNWTRGLQQPGIPPPQSATLAVLPVVHGLLLISLSRWGQEAEFK